MTGIDVSKHNNKGNPIDWAKVDASGIDFALIRAGFGNSISQKDSKFDFNVQHALAHGLHVGAYWFSYAVSVADAQKEANEFNQVLQPYKGKLTFPVSFDFEYDSYAYFNEHVGRAPSNAEITAMADAFLTRMKSYGWFVNIYTNCDYIKTRKFSAALLKRFDVWLADYSGAPDYPCYIQQTGSTGKVPGISGTVDLDVSYRDYPTMIKAGGYNGFPKPAMTVKSDTTMPVSLKCGKGYTAKFTFSGDINVTVGTANVVKFECISHSGNVYLYKFTAIGKAGSGVGIFTNGQKQFTINVI